MKNIIKQIAVYSFCIVLADVLCSCTPTHIEFTINWTKIIEVAVYIAVGVMVTFGIIAYLFRNFKVW